eukprot:EG_transcript_11096
MEAATRGPWRVEPQHRNGMKGLYATADLRRGEVVFVDEPLVSVCAGGSEPEGPVCTGCSRPLCPPLTVGPGTPPASPPTAPATCACGALFCSAACCAAQRAAFHGVECPALSPHPEYAARLPAIAEEAWDVCRRTSLSWLHVKLVLRMVSTAVAESDRAGCSFSHSCHALFGSFVADAALGSAQQEAGLRRALEHHALRPLLALRPLCADAGATADTLWWLLKVVRTNSCLFAASSSDGQLPRVDPEADLEGYDAACRAYYEGATVVNILAIFRVHSCLNHSHAPNACLTTTKPGRAPAVCVVALLPIAAGEEVCISYGVWDRDIEGWASECLCAVCVMQREGRLPSLSDAALEAARRLAMVAEDYRRCVAAVPAAARATAAAELLAPDGPEWWRMARAEVVERAQQWLGDHLDGTPTYLPAVSAAAALLRDHGLGSADALLGVCLPEVSGAFRPE